MLSTLKGHVGSFSEETGAALTSLEGLFTSCGL